MSLTDSGTTWTGIISVGGTVIVGGLMFLGWWMDPYRTKPIPAFHDMKAELKTLAQADSSEEYNVIWDRSNPDRLVSKHATLPSVIRGNIYHAILTLDEYFSKFLPSNETKTFLKPYYKEAIYRWNPDKEPFIKAFCRCIQDPDEWLYLQRRITL